MEQKLCSQFPFSEHLLAYVELKHLILRAFEKYFFYALNLQCLHLLSAKGRSNTFKVWIFSMAKEKKTLTKEAFNLSRPLRKSHLKCILQNLKEQH